jgi:hypothetical protein
MSGKPKKRLRKRKAQSRQAVAAETHRRRKHDRRRLTMATFDEWGGRRKLDAHAQNLSLALEAAVPFRIEEVRRWSWDVVKRRAEECVELLGGYSEPLMESGWSRLKRKKRREIPGLPPVHPPDTSVKAVFNALVDSCAIGALQPGGIRLLGLHFEAQP